MIETCGDGLDRPSPPHAPRVVRLEGSNHPAGTHAQGGQDRDGLGSPTTYSDRGDERPPHHVPCSGPHEIDDGPYRVRNQASISRDSPSRAWDEPRRAVPRGTRPAQARSTSPKLFPIW